MEMLAFIIVTGLIITGIHVAFWPGNIFSFVREWVATRLDRLIGKKVSRYVQKPLWDCLPCMASVWTCLLTWSIDVLLILGVCGFLVYLDTRITNPDGKAVEG